MSGLSDHLTQIRASYMGVLAELDITDDLEQLAAALTILEEIKADHKLTHGEVEQKFIALVGDAPEVVANGKFVRVAHSTPRKTWDHARLKSKVMERLLQLSIDQDTGEVLLTPQETADRLLEFAHVDYWRAKQLKEIDINPDMFCQMGDEKITTRIEDY